MSTTMTGTYVSTDVRPRLLQLAEALASDDQLVGVRDALDRQKPATIDGAAGSSCALAIAALARRSAGPLVVVCSKAAEIEALVDDLALFSDEVPLRFPAWQSDPGQRLIYDEIYGDRLRTMCQLMDPDWRGLVLCSVQSLLQPVPLPDAVNANSRRIQVGDTLLEDDLPRWLASRGFHNTSGVELPGEYSVRGGIIDLFPPDAINPVRIELFGDDVESLRRFDVSSQRSLDSLEEVRITILPSGGNDDMRAAENRDQLFAYLPESARFALMEMSQLDAEAAAYLERQDDVKSVYDWTSTKKKLAKRGYVQIASFADIGDEASFKLPTATVERFSGEISKVKEELEAAVGDDEVILVAPTEGESQRLAEIFTETTLMRDGRIHFAEGNLTTGFRWDAAGLLLLGVNELFQRSHLRRRKRKHLGKRIDSFMDLRAGDLVVHLGHGIGRYRGIEKLQRENQIEDHLIIEFAKGTKLFVPATKIELVQKYVGGSKAKARLATIGGVAWQQRKKAAASAVTDMAVELLELQARRAARPGIAFPADTEWQREFGASFPYEETEDQLHAIEAIKSDMQQPRPMDRLLCGDVGFGKTEVAMRAAFKAADSGYQVAVLVPTTILAEQHYRTFRQRLSEFPYHIARLSRFCSAAEEREIVERLKVGQVDIVIGTHRLASKDVRFENLGLLIIDEEQRFGVAVKERLKSMRTTIDVLTMTATPIPRTLHMSMTGMRDISNLEVAPDERIPVETRLTRWDDELIRMGIIRELNRGGQVYFVHNRVFDIENVKDKLQRIVPEASIRIGHGQMNEHDLEEVMVDFGNGAFDVLLATTIVESGLDIPNANTIFIDDANQYGLSDLHQLRGRVGRYKHRAYCYLLVDKNKHVTPEAARRLRAIEEFSHMGAGFAIAMRDLEFRGAGNVLGSQQSGHIAAVGYEMYCELLEAAVRKLKKLPPRLSIDVNIDLPGEAFIPDEYLPDQRTKIDLYRRLSRVQSFEDLEEIRVEIKDRFGEPPLPVQRMLALVELKIEAAIWQVESISLDDQDGKPYLVFQYTDEARIRQLVRQQKDRKKRLRVVDDSSAYLPLPAGTEDPDFVLDQVRSVLRAD